MYIIIQKTVGSIEWLFKVAGYIKLNDTGVARKQDGKNVRYTSYGYGIVDAKRNDCPRAANE